MKMIVAFLCYLIPVSLLISGIDFGIAGVFLLYLLSGLGFIFIGLNVMHDANHGVFAKNKTWNKFMGLSLNLLGINMKLWCIKHNVLHHTYTNIHGADDDIDAPFILRLNPSSKKYKIHKFQHIYAWFIYGFFTITWIFFRDFKYFARFKEMGLIKGNAAVELFKVVVWKLFYVAVTLVLPMVMLEVSPWIIILAFVSMHFMIGVVITTIFQLAHVVPGTDFPIANEEGNVENNWYIHQLETTANFSPKSKIMSWFIGGLNYQIEHHLFPKVSHVHYKNISKIVRQTAKEFGLKYNVQSNLFHALSGHARLLKSLGR
jgi:linoleoyl-CoA desaturase